MYPVKEPTTITEALNATAQRIYDVGWRNLAHPDRTSSSTGECAVVAMVHVVPDNGQLRVDALNALLNAVYDYEYTENSCAHAAPGVFVGLWNDKQTDPNVVIDKFLEVARANA